MEILVKEEFRELGLDIPKSSKLSAQQAVMLNRVEEELLSTSDVANADDKELQEITENAVTSTEDLITSLMTRRSSNILCTSFWGSTRR